MDGIHSDVPSVPVHRVDRVVGVGREIHGQRGLFAGVTAAAALAVRLQGV